MNNLRTSPLSSCKNLPPFFHGAFAPSFIWRRRPAAGPDAVRGLAGVNWPIALNVFRLQILRRRVSESSEMQC